MQRGWFLYARKLQRLTEYQLYAAISVFLTWLEPLKEPFQGANRFVILPEHFNYLDRNRHYSVILSFGLPYDDNTALAIYVCEKKVQQFTTEQSSSID